MSELLRIERDGNVALVRLLRTDKHNAFNRDLSDAFRTALDELDADDSARSVVLTGEGRAFSAGADMTEAVKAIDGSGRSEGMGSAIARAATFTKPLLACVNGICYGGGALLAITCDIRIASDDAAFRFPGAAYGLVVGGSQLPRIIGPAFAKELLFTGRVVQADEALRMGLVNAVVPRTQVEHVSTEMARQIAANSPAAVMATKQVVDRAVEVDDAVRMEAEWNAGLRASPEHHERFKAAAERVASRPPADG
jgi:enoyl-CoA hydratase/carnithine racemase